MVSRDLSWWSVPELLAVRTFVPGNDILWVLIPWIMSLTTPKHEEIAED